MTGDAREMTHLTRRYDAPSEKLRCGWGARLRWVCAREVDLVRDGAPRVLHKLWATNFSPHVTNVWRRVPLVVQGLISLDWFVILSTSLCRSCWGGDYPSHSFRARFARQKNGDAREGVRFYRFLTLTHA